MPHLLALVGANAKITNFMCLRKTRILWLKQPEILLPIENKRQFTLIEIWRIFLRGKIKWVVIDVSYLFYATKFGLRCVMGRKIIVFKVDFHMNLLIAQRILLPTKTKTQPDLRQLPHLCSQIIVSVIVSLKQSPFMDQLNLYNFLLTTQWGWIFFFNFSFKMSTSVL